MASEGAKNFRPKPYNERGRRSERRRSFLGIVKDTVKGLFQSSWLEQPIQTDTAQEEKHNHIQQQSGNSASNVEGNLGQSYIQPSCQSSSLPGPSKLLPQMPVGLASSSGPVSGMPRLDCQGSATRQDTVTFSSDLPFGQFDDKSTSLIVNGGDDRSEFSDCSVSTSGCSSMAGNQDKDFQQETSHLQKPGLQKPDFGVSHSHKRGESSFLWSGTLSRPSSKSGLIQKTTCTTTRSRTPSFNVSVFGSPLSKTTAPRSGHSDSHFYPGKTVYGGASSQKKRKLQETSPQLTPNKRQVHAKPVTSSISGVTSTSARRILSVLERMSSPLQDAKKIPSYNSSLADSPLSFTPSSIASAARRRSIPYRMGSSLLKGPPVRALITPGRVQVAKNYQSSLSQKDTTRNDPPKSSGQQFQSATVTHSYSDFNVGGGSRPGKVKQSRSQHYSSRKDEDDMVVAPDLPTEFTLPVSVVPKFSFGQTTTSTQQSSESHTKQTVSDGIYTFSTPIPQSVPDPATSCSVQNFEFSSPITMGTTPSQLTCQKAVASLSSLASTSSSPSLSSSLPSNHKSNISNAKPDLSFKFNPTTAKSKSDGTYPGTKGNASPTTESIFKPAEQLKTGSVMDILRPKTSESESSSANARSSFSTDLNKDEKKQATDSSGCKLNGDQTGGTGKPSLSELFKKPSDKWECPTCMIHNKEESSKCVACETAKPSASSAKKPITSEPVPNIPVDKSLAEKFKKPEGSWECDTCMVNNTSTATKCIACETPKPGQTKATSFITAGGFQFAPKTTNSTNNQFVSSTFGQSSAQDKTNNVSTSGFKFGESIASNKDVASVKTENSSKAEPVKSGGFKFGQSLDSSSANAVSPATGGFSFGQSLKSDSGKTEPSFTGGFKFGSSSQTGDSKKDGSNIAAGGFSFGQTAFSVGNSKSGDNSKEQPGGIAAGVSSGDGKRDSTGTVLKSDSSSTSIFHFGTDNKPTESTAKTQENSTVSLATSSVVGLGSGTGKAAETNSGTEVKPVFAFGSSEKKGDTTSSTATSLFTFGQVSSAPKSSVLGVPQKTDDQAAVSPAISTNLATFAAVTKSQDAKPASTFIFGQSAQASDARTGAGASSSGVSGSGLTFGGQSATSVSTGNQPSQPAASTVFGSQSTQLVTSTAFGGQPTQPTVNTAFGSQSTQPSVNTLFGSQSTQPASDVTFGGPSTQAAANSSVLGQPTQAAGNSGFGGQTATTAAAAAAAPSFNFGAPAVSTNGPSIVPTFNFSAKPNDKQGTATTSSSEFNLAAGTAATTTSTTTSAPGTNLFAFSGAKQESPMSALPTLSNSSPFQFGQNTKPSGSPFNMPATSTTTTSTFIFGQPTSTTSGLGTFGSQSASASAFGGFAKSASTPAFGSTVKTAAESSAPAFGAPTPAFGSANPAPSFASTANPPSFGATTSTPAFGTPSQQAQPPSVFGSGTATPGFQFGSPQPAVQQPALGGVFQFGQNAQQPAAPNTGFNFGAGVAGSSATNTAASINFGGSTPANTTFTGASSLGGSTFQFNAMPSGPANNPFSVTTPASSRRVKTARRKLPRK